MSNEPIHVSDEKFDEIVGQAELPVLVDFWAPWCGPCRRVAPILDDLAREYAGKIVVAKVNADEHQESALRLGVQGIPTLILFKDGQEVSRQVGVLPKFVLKEWVNAAIAN
jgi:thioredoxin 1